MQIKNMVASVLFYLVGFISVAQAEGVPPPPAPPPPPGLPIDDGIILLIVAALVYGAYSAYVISRRTT